MKRIVIKFITGVLVAICSACTTSPQSAEVRPRKVVEQRLAAYTPLRRLTYRDACGSEGPLTICVDRISVSDTATLVETRVKNALSQPYLLEGAKESAVLLADDAGMIVESYQAWHREWQGLEERVVHFRLEGHFSGEPAIFTVKNIRRKSPEHADKGFFIVVRLGE